MSDGGGVLLRGGAQGACAAMVPRSTLPEWWPVVVSANT